MKCLLYNYTIEETQQLDVRTMKKIHLPADAARIISTSSMINPNDVSVDDKWVKQNSHGYEGQAEVLASLKFEQLIQ